MTADAAALWSSDLFDREAPAREEGRFSSLEAGLQRLWFHVLEEGVLDDGRPTFTDFTLRVPGRASVSLPRDPFSNPALRQLRWRLRNDEPSFVVRLAALHHARLDEPFAFAPFLALPVQLPAGVHRVLAALAGALGVAPPLEAEAGGWRQGPAEGLHLAVRRRSGRGPAQSYFPQAWSVELRGAAAFAVVLEGDDPSSASAARVEAEGSPAARTLADALLEAGVALEPRAPGRT